MHIKVNSYSSDELLLNHEAKQDGASRLLVALGSGLMFWLSLFGFACWVMISSSLANDSSPKPTDPLVMKVYPDGTKVILRWSDVGKGVDTGSSHGGAPKIVAYDPAKDGVVPIGEQSRTNGASSTKVPMASNSLNSQTEVPAKDAVAGMPKDDSWYVGLQNGASFVQDINIPPVSVGGLSLDKAQLNTGYRLDLPIGYRVNEWFSCEFAPGFTYNTFDSLQGDLGGIGGSVGVGGSLVQVPLMFNGILTIPTDCPLEPYLGGGIGALYSNSKIEAGNLGPVFPEFEGQTLNSHSWAFAYSGLAGINYHIDQNISVGICYKFTGTGPQNWQGQDGGYTTHTLTQSAEVTATLRF